ncbi:MAG: outer membrane lipoprotein-sorting protein [Gammaproteobacteria bacterium]|nr:outer membrane lipoprotein-sorting protein [Gammaproteobacteria bacterium]
MKKSLGVVLTGSLLILGLFSYPGLALSVQVDESWTGHRIMERVSQRHERFPYVFEEQTMILMDRVGNRDVRKLRRFTRVEENGAVKFLLVFDNPPEVRGVALLAIHYHDRQGESGIYLPAFGKKMLTKAGEGREGSFLGTDFSIGDLSAEVLADFSYVRVAERRINKYDYFVVEAFPRDKEVERVTGYGLRRHFIRPDNLFIVRTDYFDPHGRLFKRQTYHDLKLVNGSMWRANMILMENYRERHKTLIKIDRRVFSHDYVPSELFTQAWILENRHIKGADGPRPRSVRGPGYTPSMGIKPVLHDPKDGGGRAPPGAKVEELKPVKGADGQIFRAISDSASEDEGE